MGHRHGMAMKISEAFEMFFVRTTHRQRLPLARLLACTLYIAGGRGGNAFLLGYVTHPHLEPRHQLPSVATGRGVSLQSACTSMVGGQTIRRPACPLPSGSAPLLQRRHAAGAIHGAVGTALAQTRGEAKGSTTGDSIGRGGRQGSGSLPYVDPPGLNLRAIYLSQVLSGFADRMWEVILCVRFCVCIHY